LTLQSLYNEPEAGNYLGCLFPANAEAVAKVLNAPENDDGRSGWTWLRLGNGDLMLGIFPCGDTYCEVELDVAADFTKAASDA
jgi:hypothetical protein